MDPELLTEIATNALRLRDAGTYRNLTPWQIEQLDRMNTALHDLLVDAGRPDSFQRNRIPLVGDRCTADGKPGTVGSTGIPGTTGDTRYVVNLDEGGQVLEARSLIVLLQKETTQ